MNIHRTFLYALIISASAAHLAALPEAVDVLGYDPESTLAPAHHAEDAVACVCGHGFGASKKNFGLADTPRFCPVSFHYHDSREKGGRLWWRNGNLGQEHDAMTFLYHVAYCVENGYSIVTALVESRSGATLIRSLHMIEFPERYIPAWEKFGYVHPNGSPDLRKIGALRKALQQRKLFLARPLLSAKAALNIAAERSISPILHGPARWLVKTAASLFTKYDSSQPEPIELLEEMVQKGLPYKLEIYRTVPDGTVSNKPDAKLFELAKQSNGMIKIHTVNSENICNIWLSFHKEAARTPKPVAQFAHDYIPDAIEGLQECFARELNYTVPSFFKEHFANELKEIDTAAA